MNKIDIKLKDFQLYNEWEKRGDLYMDKSTGRIYPIFNDNTSRCKQLLSGVVSSIMTSGVNFLHRGIALISFSHFWWHCAETPYNLKDRLINVGIDLIGFFATPLIFVALQVTVIYALFKPLDGTKLYASIERAGCRSVGRPYIQPINLDCFPTIWNSFASGAAHREIRAGLLSMWQEKMRSGPNNPQLSENLTNSTTTQTLNIDQRRSTMIAIERKNYFFCMPTSLISYVASYLSSKEMIEEFVLVSKIFKQATCVNWLWRPFLAEKSIEVISGMAKFQFSIYLNGYYNKTFVVNDVLSASHKENPSDKILLAMLMRTTNLDAWPILNRAIEELWSDDIIHFLVSKVKVSPENVEFAVRLEYSEEIVLGMINRLGEGSILRREALRPNRREPTNIDDPSLTDFGKRLVHKRGIMPIVYTDKLISQLIDKVEEGLYWDHLEYALENATISEKTIQKFVNKTDLIEWSSLTKVGRYSSAVLKAMLEKLNTELPIQVIRSALEQRYADSLVETLVDKVDYLMPKSVVTMAKQAGYSTKMVELLSAKSESSCLLM